jgi:hypothetical protein
MAVVTVAAFSIGAALTSNARRGTLLVLGSTGAALLASAIVGAAAVASNTNSGVGLERAVGDLSIFGLRPLELVVPPTGNLVLGDRLDSFWETRLHGSNPTEATNYVGLLTIALALAWLVVAWRRRRTLSPRARIATVGLVAAFVAGLAFAAPSPILLFGHEVQTPARLLWEIVPAFRVISRWDPLLVAALVPLAALGLQALSRAIAGGRRPIWIAGAVVGVAMIVSFLELAIHPAEARFRTAPVPPEYAAIEKTPPGILAEYPLGYADVYRLWQGTHGRPVVNGAPPDSQADYARLVLLDPAQPGTAQALALLGVTAIAIHPNAHVDAEVLPGDPATSPGYKLVGRFADGASVWEVTAPAAPALAMPLPGGFGKPRRVGGLVGYPLVSSSGVAVLEFAARTPGVVRLLFDATPPKGAQRPLRLADSKGEQAFTLNGRTLVSLNVEIPRGLSQLLVKTDPPAKSERDAVVLSVPRTEKASGEASLHADLITPDPGF